MGLVDVNGVEVLYGASGNHIEVLTGVTGAGNDISLKTVVTEITTTGASSGALADGKAGQEKIIICAGHGGNYVLTPANLANGTTITFTAVNQYVKLHSLTGGDWVVVGGTATVA